MKAFLFFIVLFSFLFSCSEKREKSISLMEYYGNGSIKEKYMCNKAGVFDGEYIKYYENGVVKERGNYVNGKLRGYQYKYDTIGQLSYLYFNILIYDSIFNYWDYNTDTMDAQNKISMVNSCWKYKEDGSIDTMNSCFYKYYISDSVSCGDTVLFQLKVVAPYFKGNSSSYEMLFKETEDSKMDHYDKNMTDAFYGVKFIARKKGWNKSYFLVYEHNKDTKEIVEHYGYAPYYVK